MYAISLLCQSNITVETTNTIGARRPVWTALLLAVGTSTPGGILASRCFPESFTTLLVVVAHVRFFVVGLWAMRRAPHARPANWLAVLALSAIVVGAPWLFRSRPHQKDGRLNEQTLMLILVGLLVRPKSA